MLDLKFIELKDLIVDEVDEIKLNTHNQVELYETTVAECLQYILELEQPIPTIYNEDLNITKQGNYLEGTYQLYDCDEECYESIFIEGEWYRRELIATIDFKLIKIGENRFYFYTNDKFNKRLYIIVK